jgi:hypothetical protein
MATTVCENCNRKTPTSSSKCVYCYVPINVDAEKNAEIMSDVREYKKCTSGHKNAVTEDYCRECPDNLMPGTFRMCRKCRKNEVPGDMQLCEDCAASEQDGPEKEPGKKVLEPLISLQPRIVCQSNPLFNPEIKSGDVIGREGDINTTCLNNDEVSNKHASFIKEGDAWFIRDEGSTNGTMVNWRPIAPHKKVPLSNGSVIVLADGIIFVFGMV